MTIGQNSKKIKINNMFSDIFGRHNINVLTSEELRNQYLDIIIYSNILE